MINNHLSGLSRRRTVEWWIVFLLSAFPFVNSVVQAVRNFSVEPLAVVQIAALPIVVSGALLWGLWFARRWAIWLLLAQAVLFGAAYSAIVGQLAGVDYMLVTAIVIGLYYAALMLMYRDVMRGLQAPVPPAPPVEPAKE